MDSGNLMQEFAKMNISDPVKKKHCTVFTSTLVVVCMLNTFFCNLTPIFGIESCKIEENCKVNCKV